MIILSEHRETKKTSKLWLDPRHIVSMQVVDGLTMIRCVGNVTFFVVEEPQAIMDRLA